MNTELKDTEIKILQLLCEEYEYREIAETLGVCTGEVDNFLARIKFDWQVKGPSGICRETIRRGYLDLGNRMDYVYLHHWMERVQTTPNLRNTLVTYSGKYSDREGNVILGDISLEKFLLVPGASLMQWKEFLGQRSLMSSQLKGLTKIKG